MSGMDWWPLFNNSSMEAAPGARPLPLSVDDQDHIVTESAIRAFYAYYRQVMGL